jgi:REP element-mobilizing transposase RayT
MPDHVHLLVALAPTVSVARLVQQLKGSSAHFVAHILTPDAPFRWQGGYGAFTLRKADAPIVRRYVLGQKEHHAKRSLQPDWELTEEVPGGIAKRPSSD